MTMLWGLRQMNIVKQLNHGVIGLSSKNPTLPNSINRLCCSALQRIPPPKISPKLEQKFQAVDKVSTDYSLVYKSSIGTIIKWSYYSGYGLVFIGVAGVFYFFYNPDLKSATSSSTDMLHTNFMGQDANEMLIMSFVLILTNIALILFCRMHVPRIWFNSKTNQYKMRLVGSLPGIPREIVFEPGVPKLKRKNPKTSIGRASHLIHGKTYHLMESNFKTPAEYERFIGTAALP